MMLKIKARLNKLFADKQIYIRSQGKVIVVPLSARSQIFLGSFLAAICLWVGFASVNVLFLCCTHVILRGTVAPYFE